MLKPSEVTFVDCDAETSNCCLYVTNKLNTNYIAFLHYVDPPVGWGSTYCFTAVGVGVGVTSITKAPPAQIFFGWHVFCSPGHWLLISAMTLTFGVKVKL